MSSWEKYAGIWYRKAKFALLLTPSIANLRSVKASISSFDAQFLYSESYSGFILERNFGSNLRAIRLWVKRFGTRDTLSFVSFTLYRGR